MKLSLFAAAFALAANAIPLVDVEKTSISFDENKAALDSGRLSVHLSRVDDLIDENDSNRLLLERLTHVAIEIQILPGQGCMRVNSQDIPLVDDSKTSSGAPASVHIVKAESYSIPSDLPEALWSPEGIDALTNVMSKGIVAVEIKLEREDVKVDAIGNDVALALVDNVKLRRIGLYMKIHEIEGVDLERVSLVYTPVVQLLVKSDEDGSTQFTTLSIAGQPVTEDPRLLIPEVDIEEEEMPHILPAFRHHPHHAHDSGLWNWIQSLVGNQNEEFHRAQRHPHYGLAANGLAHARLGRPAAGTHRHHKHGACFTRRLARGLSYVFSSLVAFFTTTLVGSMMLGLIAGSALFSVIHRIKNCARRRAEARAMREAQAYMDEDKHAVYYIVEGDELPDYETAHASPLFDAEAEQKLMDEKSEKN